MRGHAVTQANDLLYKYVSSWRLKTASGIVQLLSVHESGSEYDSKPSKTYIDMLQTAMQCTDCCVICAVDIGSFTCRSIPGFAI